MVPECSYCDEPAAYSVEIRSLDHRADACDKHIHEAIDDAIDEHAATVTIGRW